MLANVETDLRAKKIKRSTTLILDQNSSESTIHGVFIYHSRSPNKPKQLQCVVVQNAVLTHDAMIASPWHRNCWTFDGNHTQPLGESEAKDKNKQIMHTAGKVEIQDFGSLKGKVK